MMTINKLCNHSNTLTITSVIFLIFSSCNNIAPDFFDFYDLAPVAVGNTWKYVYLYGNYNARPGSQCTGIIDTQTFEIKNIKETKIGLVTYTLGYKIRGLETRWINDPLDTAPRETTSINQEGECEVFDFGDSVTTNYTGINPFFLQHRLSENIVVMTADEAINFDESYRTYLKSVKKNNVAFFGLNKSVNHKEILIFGQDIGRIGYYFNMSGNGWIVLSEVKLLLFNGKVVGN